VGIPPREHGCDLYCLLFYGRGLRCCWPVTCCRVGVVCGSRSEVPVFYVGFCSSPNCVLQAYGCADYLLLCRCEVSSCKSPHCPRSPSNVNNCVVDKHWYCMICVCWKLSVTIPSSVTYLNYCRVPAWPFVAMFPLSYR
jgi:hypothetical protein